MENPKQQNQSRFFIAVLLCMAILFGWQYFFAPKPKPTDNANTAQVANTENAPTQQTQTASQPQPQQTAAVTPDSVPNRQITIKSDLFEVKIDSKGALATSWILFKDKTPKGERPIFADGSNENDQKPLQLISDEAKNRNPRELPFRLSTDDQSLNAALNDRNYQASVAEDTINLAPGEEKQLDFTLTDGSGAEVKKTFVFRADSYVADLQIRLTRNGQPVPNTKLLVGASVGDQGIEHHNFYHIEPEAIAYVDNNIFRRQGTSFTYEKDKNGVESKTSAQTPAGNVSWAGVGDAYFAMVAVPSQMSQGLEYHVEKYDVNVKPFYDGIFSWVLRREKTSETRHLMTAYVPVATDGSTTQIYTGTKDYFALANYNDNLSSKVGRQLNLEDLINFSNWTWFRWTFKHLSIPILYALNFINNFTGNYGVAIIVFTFLFYSLLFPLRWSQSKSFKKASGNAPKMKEIQDKIKELTKKGVPMDDPRMRQLQMEQLKMTKDALPIGGCLPMLLQFPLLIAFYTAVTVSLAIRQASFLWLPDLSTGDPYHILEFAFAVSMILSMKFTPTTPTVTPEQQMQQKMMTYFMPLMMLWVMWAAPAGLLLYWFFGNIVSFGQQMLINKLNKPTDPPKEEIVDTVPKGAKKVKPKLSTS